MVDIDIGSPYWDRYDRIKPDIDLRGRSGDIRYECPVCHWGVTLTAEGAVLWTHDGAVTPRCRKDHVDLTWTVF